MFNWLICSWFLLVFFRFFVAIALSVLQCDKILQTVNHVAKYVAFWFEVDIQIAAAKQKEINVENFALQQAGNDHC